MIFLLPWEMQILFTAVVWTFQVPSQKWLNRDIKYFKTEVICKPAGL